MTEICKVAVFGAGVMGAGIAAHVANAGVPVRLFDIAASGANRNAVAESAVARMLKADPAPFMHSRNAELVFPANIDDEIGLVSDCDWIIEAIVENPEAKRALYAKIDAVRKPGSILSSNTSTIRLAALTEGLPASLARDFLITHFFNPPRYQQLVEIVRGPLTRADAVDAVTRFADHRLGKTPIPCKDEPGFIANRIGIYWLQCAVLSAIDRGLTVEAADAALSAPFGIPKTGVFGLLDMVGIDIVPHVLSSMTALLPPDDPFHAVARKPELVERMIASGLTGRKGKGGFYRLKVEGDAKVKQAMDLATGDYRDAHSSRGKNDRGNPRAMFSRDDAVGRYALEVMSRTLAYAAAVAPAVADDLAAVDDAMRLGYGWRWGPFELIDRIGPDWFIDKLVADGKSVPPLLARVRGRTFYRVAGGRRRCMTFTGGEADVPRPPGVLLLSDVKLRSKPVARNPSASLWDIGDGVLCLEFHSKMNALDPLSLAMVRKAVKLTPRRHRALVVYNEGSQFSVGANIALLLLAMKLRAWFLVDWLLKQGQHTYRDLKYAPFPVVGAPAGLSLGGACEILMHCDAVQAHAETYVGLVETGVGIIPGWGGCKEMLLRRTAAKTPPFGPMPPVVRSFETIAMANVAKSAEEAKDLGFFRDRDGITMNRDRLLADAKAKALALAPSYRAPEPVRISLPGRTAAAALHLALDGFRRLGKATAHDAVVGGELARALSGGDTDVTETLGEDDLLGLERRSFLALARTGGSRARVAHMLKTGKPLRN